MAYEMQTIEIAPGMLKEAEARFAAAYATSTAASALAAAWRSEIGPLNRIIHVWDDDDESQRTQRWQLLASEREWMDATGMAVRSESAIMAPLPFSPRLRPGVIGPIFEIRAYTYLRGDLPRIAARWERKIPRRLEFGPVCGVWTTESEGTCRLIHIWPYRSLDERMKIRDRIGGWSRDPAAPAAQVYQFVAQENLIALPTRYSPIQ